MSTLWWLYIGSALIVAIDADTNKAGLTVSKKTLALVIFVPAINTLCALIVLLNWTIKLLKS